MIICQNGEVLKEATNLYDNENYIELAVELNKNQFLKELIFVHQNQLKFRQLIMNLSTYHHILS